MPATRSSHALDHLAGMAFLGYAPTTLKVHHDHTAHTMHRIANGRRLQAEI